jgi:hypothetical protein
MPLLLIADPLNNHYSNFISALNSGWHNSLFEDLYKEFESEVEDEKERHSVAFSLKVAFWILAIKEYSNFRSNTTIKPDRQFYQTKIILQGRGLIWVEANDVSYLTEDAVRKVYGYLLNKGEWWEGHLKGINLDGMFIEPEQARFRS